ncbi:hypothetical protein ABZ599_21645 [Streptomyces misionensis]
MNGQSTPVSAVTRGAQSCADGPADGDDQVAVRVEHEPRGAGSPAAGLAMVFKLVESAQARRRAVTGADLVPLVRVGARFGNGQLLERAELAA